MKKFVMGLLIGIMLTLGVTTYAAPEIQSAIFSDIKLIVNGEQVDSEIVSVVTTDNPNYMTNYVPARALSEALGAEVEWDGKNRVINVSTKTSDNNISQELNIQPPKETNTTPSVPTSPIPKETTTTLPTTKKTNIPHPIISTDEYGVNVYNVYNIFEGVSIGEVEKALNNKGYKIIDESYDRIGIIQGNNKLVSNIWIGSYGNKIYINYKDYLEHIKPLLQ